MSDESWIEGQKFLTKMLLDFFQIERGEACRKDLHAFLEMNIEAMERHDQPAHISSAMIEFAERVANVSNIDSPSLRTRLRKDMGDPD